MAIERSASRPRRNSANDGGAHGKSASTRANVKPNEVQNKKGRRWNKNIVGQRPNERTHYRRRGHPVRCCNREPAEYGTKAAGLGCKERAGKDTRGYQDTEDNHEDRDDTNMGQVGHGEERHCCQE